MSDPELRRHILCVAADLVGEFVYYDRRGDEDLPADLLADAVKRGVVSVEEIVSEFRSGLNEVFHPSTNVPHIR